MAEVRHGAGAVRSMTTRHDAASYEQRLETIKQAVHNVLGGAGKLIHAVVDEEGRPDLSQWMTPHGPRLGAFELEVQSRRTGCLRVRGWLIDTSLRRRHPSAAATHHLAERDDAYVITTTC